MQHKKPRSLAIVVDILYPLPDDSVPIRGATENTCTGSFYCRCTAKDGELDAIRVVGFRYGAGGNPDEFPPGGAVEAYLSQFADDVYEFEIRAQSREIPNAEGECPAPADNNNRVVVWASFASLKTTANPEGWARSTPIDFKGTCGACQGTTPSVNITSPLPGDIVPIYPTSSSGNACTGYFDCTCQAHDGVDKSPCVVGYRYAAGQTPDATPPVGAVAGVEVPSVTNEFQFQIPGAEGECPAPENNNNRVVVWAKFPHLQSASSSPVWHMAQPHDFIGRCSDCNQ